MALIYRLLAVTPSSGPFPVHEVPPFVLLVVLGVSFCRCRWDVWCSGMCMNVWWDEIIPYVPGWCLLQAWWQFSVTAEGSFVREVSLVCQLFTVIPSCCLSPPHGFPAFVLLVVRDFSFCRLWHVFLSSSSLGATTLIFECFGLLSIWFPLIISFHFIYFSIWIVTTCNIRLVKKIYTKILWIN